MALGKLDFKKIEERWQAEWEKNNTYFFDEHNEEKPVYSIDSPPPFTSGALHMGHVLSYSYFDFAARYKRMMGHNVFFPQGWDCQGFPTEIKVEKQFGKGLPREEFKKKCVEFTNKNIAAMKRQMQQMGFSPDWRYEYKTMNPDYHRRVQFSLIKMFEEKLVYRAKHPVLFCTYCRSAIAKAETEEKEHETTFNTLEFTVAETGEALPIATTRPELLHACQAVFIHPDDTRAKKLAGKHAATPVFGKKVPIIADKDVDPAFGTGVVMVCSFGDKEDVQWIYRHKLPVADAWGQEGKIVNAGEGFDGLNINAMREKVLEKLQENGKLLKQEKIRRVIKTHDRCGRNVDFLATMQWFIKLQESKKLVAAGKQMRWVPEFAVQYLVDWAEFVGYDWVISRQRIYGTPIPFYYCEKCGKEFAAKKEELPVDPALEKPRKCSCGGQLVGEKATCDVWVDSSITPLVIGGWPDDEKLFNKVYPASLRPQGLEIIRTWAYYTISRCLALTGKPPFKELLINGSVLGTDGKKMSKSLGNYEDPDVLLKRYSADALRQWAALSGAFARDRPFSYKDVDYSQSFLNKLWNAAKFVEKSLEKRSKTKPAYRAVDYWLLSRLNSVVKQCGEAMKNYDYYACVSAVHAFFWHEFCDYYLEDVKYRIYSEEHSGQASKAAAQECLEKTLSAALRLLAPFAPFVTEEIYSAFFGKSIHSSEWPACEEEYINESKENIGVALHSILSEVRKFKASKTLALNEDVSSAEITLPQSLLGETAAIEEEISRVGKVKNVSFVEGSELKVSVKV